MNTTNLLLNFPCLDASVAIYVPSTVSINIHVDASNYTNKTLTFLSDLFGGATKIDGVGSWLSDTVGMVQENVQICTSNCNNNDLQAKIPQVINFCQDLCKFMEQECITLVVNGKMYFVD